jgi:hypothetical protein
MLTTRFALFSEFNVLRSSSRFTTGVMNRLSQSHCHKSLMCPSLGSGALQRFEAAASCAAVRQTSSIMLFLFGNCNIRGQCF